MGLLPGTLGNAGFGQLSVSATFYPTRVVGDHSHPKVASSSWAISQLARINPLIPMQTHSVPVPVLLQWARRFMVFPSKTIDLPCAIRIAHLF